MTTTGPALRTGMATDVGRVREQNEDDAFADGALCVVADGMGGHAAGEVASRLAVDTLSELATRSGIGVEDIVTQVEEANTRILAAAEDPHQRGMATTISGVAVVDVDGRRRWVVFNLGDSRVYRYVDGGLTQVTVDHSEVQQLVDIGCLTPEQALTHPLRHTVTRSLGRTLDGPVDTWLLTARSGDRFVVCSDGLTNELSDAEIAEILGAGHGPQHTATVLVERAVGHGGRDNVTVIVADADAELDGEAGRSSESVRLVH